MALIGDGLLAIWHDIDPDVEAEFHHWYREEHLAERVGVPGFLRARRYVAVAGGPKYAALYETETPEVLTSAAYLARLNDPTPLSARMLALFRNTVRSVCQVRASLGLGIGGAMATVWLAPQDGRDQALGGWLAETALPGLVASERVVGAHLCVVDPALTRNDSTETENRAVPDDIGDWVVVVEALDDEAISAALEARLSTEDIARNGGAETARARYRLLHTVAADDLPAPGAQA